MYFITKHTPISYYRWQVLYKGIGICLTDYSGFALHVKSYYGILGSETNTQHKCQHYFPAQYI